MSIRSFIALPIPFETVNELGDIAGKMSYQDKNGAVNWVDQANYHITLAFLGEQEQEDLELLAEKLDEKIIETEFRLNLTHPCPFPEAKPRLLATMVDQNDEINNIHRQVISAVKSVGMSFDKRKFIPHITLGYYENKKNAYAGKIPTNVSFETVVDDVVLYQSVQTSSGSEYETIYSFPLDELPYDDI